MAPSMDGAMDHLPWTMPFRSKCHSLVNMAYSIDVHHRSHHGVVRGARWTAPWTAPWFSQIPWHAHGTYHGSMDCAMVQSMNEPSSMTWSIASSMDDHGFVRGRRHGVGCPWHRSWSTPWHRPWTMPYDARDGPINVDWCFWCS